MARTIQSKLSKGIREALAGLPDVQLRQGKRHIKIIVNGRFAGIAPKCVSGDGQVVGSGERNTIASIRRAANFQFGR